ncbi:FecR family protein [Dysgonomonas sp.]
MDKDISILIEKVFMQQANAEEVELLRQLFVQAQDGEMEEKLSGLYLKKWEQASSHPEKEVEERVWNRLQNQLQLEISNKQTLSLWKRCLYIAASIFIPLFCVGLGYYLSEYRIEQSNDRVSVEVEIGQKANITLPDGTCVWLNSSSLLTYDNTYNKKNRTVYLEGEACFAVHKNKSSPFIVKTNEISIEALGTTFDVKAYSDDNYIMATLLEGSIRINSLSRSEILIPDEKLIISKSDGQFSKVVLSDAEKSISWVNNKLAFEKERLEDICKTLERMYNVQIQFASEELKNIRFSGLIKNNNLENILQSITFVSPMRFSMENNIIIICNK